MYTDFSLNNVSEKDSVLNYKDLRFSGDAMVYGSDGQAAYKARPVTAPEVEQQQTEAPETEFRPMPSAVLFEDVGHVARRRKAPRALSAVLSIAVTLIAAAALFGLVRMSGEINALTIEVNDLSDEINDLRKEESRLNYIINTDMNELEMLEYAKTTLRMEEASSANTVSMDFNGGDRYELGSVSGEESSVFGQLGGIVRAFTNYIG